MGSQKTAGTIRREFIEFFKSKQHSFIPSSPVVPQDDPTLLFTNAGMNQFKAILLGDNKDGLRRAANSQKCMRVSGKHNDLEEVGRDHHHHTFFEMLGNWSFGDYYKKDAIGWAWELLTGVWKLPKDKLYATVYEKDDEAESLWKSQTDIAHDHISRFGAQSNFWEMGETGPCGPCSEIHIDRGEGFCAHEKSTQHTCGVNADGCGRYIELWNLVFMQHNRDKDGTLRDLPAKNVDTGMGFERVTSVIQGCRSNYDTDVFRPIIAHLERLSGRAYASDGSGTPFRVIADHMRALTFAITDGAFPSNEGRGYVLRRLLRRAVRFGRELGFHQPFLHTLVPTVVEMMGEAFPEITQRVSYVQQVIRSEEERFGQTLEQGLEKFGALVDECKSAKANTLAGASVFMLYDTYGFPMDLTRLMAEEKGLAIDEAGFEDLMGKQRQRARSAMKRGEEEGLTADGWFELKTGASTEFVGYDTEQAQCRIYRFKPVGEGGYLACLDRTPFYAESGGQVGDRGTLTSAGGKLVNVVETIKWNDMIVHRLVCSSSLLPADIEGCFTAAVNAADRAATRRNHSATHLLQAALRSVLGNHVQQSGSRVDPTGLRFDFTHFRAVTPRELEAVVLRVNEWILENVTVATQVKAVDEAKKDGAIALFGEKYGESVRVVTMGSVSKELCGGTHVRLTGDIGVFHITGESSIAAGVRRIEATTGLNAVSLFLQRENRMTELLGLLKSGEDKVVERVSALLTSVSDLERKVAALSAQAAAATVRAFFDESKQSGGSFPWLAKNLGTTDKESFTRLSDALSDAVKAQPDDTHVFVLAARVEDKALFSACAGQAAVKTYKVHSGELVKMAAQKAGGGGGGSPVRAQAGGKEPGSIGDALLLVTESLSAKAGRP